LEACINCWNDIDVYRARDYFFTTLGIFSFHDEDRERLERQIKSELNLQLDDETG